MGRGAAGAEGVGFGEGVFPLPNMGGAWAGGCAPFPENFFNFLAQNSAFWRLF